MKSDNLAIARRSRRCLAAILASIAVVAFLPCALLVSRWPKDVGEASKDATRPTANLIEPRTIVLAPQTGDSRTDREISRLQQRVREGRDIELTLEQLGWAFVTKARTTFDAGFYKLAEQCALGIEKRNPQSQAAMLLRGHVLQNLHQFKESEALARRLVDQRGLCFDYGLLGDALMEQGRLKEAVEAYQRMMNLKPDLHAYARAAHIRWLKGDLDGAIEAMQLAVSAASPLDPESAAWVHTRLASYELQAGRLEEAEERCALALSFHSNYAPTLLLQGKMLLSQNKPDRAVELLQTAAKLNPLPEYQWALDESLRAAGSRGDEAATIEAQLRKHGAASDPRTYALFLATRHESPETALQLAKAEFGSRGDVFTHDALAWALAAAGKINEARTEMGRALAEGTKDGRLFFHAAVIEAKTGHKEEALGFFEQATRFTQLLLPSEREQLQLVSGAINNDFADSVRPVIGATALSLTPTESPRRD
jgi:tetratricopeptide (TPR) repeat protein